MNNVNGKAKGFEGAAALQEEAAKFFEALNKDFRSLDCGVCSGPFAYQFRADPTVVMCGPRCLAIARKKLMELPGEARHASLVAMKVGLSRTTSTPTGLTTRYVTDVRETENVEHPTAQFKELHELLQADNLTSTKQSNYHALHVEPEPSWPTEVLENVKIWGEPFKEKLIGESKEDWTEMEENMVKKSQVEDTVESWKTWSLCDMKISDSFIDGAPVNVTYTWDAVTYTVQAVVDEDCINDLQDGIRQHCTLAPTLQKAPAVEQVVLAIYPLDGAVYRAEVIKSNNFDDKYIQVQYVDFGGSAKVTFEQCWEPSQEIMELHPRYGLVINLPLPDTVREIPSLEECGNAHANAIANDQFTLNVLQEQPVPSPWTATMVTKDWLDISHFFPLHFQQEINGMGEPAEATNEPELLPRESELDLGSTRKRVKKFEGMALSSSFRYGAAVSISHFWTLSKLTLTALADDKALDDLGVLIEAFVKTVPPILLLRKPQVDDVILGLYYETYYRARILEVMGNNVKLEFIDYGDERTVSINNCRDISDELFKIPVFGLKFRIESLPPDLPFVLAKEGELSGCWELEVAHKMDFVDWRGQLWGSDGKSFAEIAQA